MKQYLEILQCTAPHGIRGECRAVLLCDSADAIRAVKTVRVNGENGKVLTVASIRPHANGVLIRFAGIDTPEEVGTLRGAILYADRGDIRLGRDRVFIDDLIGQPVYREETDEVLGTLREVLEYPANQVYVIDTGKGTVLFPAVKEFILRADAENGIHVRVIPGMFEEV